MSLRSSVEEQPSPKGQAAGSNPAGGTTPTIGALDKSHLQQIYEHLLRLSPDDRRLRFCTGASDSFIHRYVFEVMDLERDLVYGAFVDGTVVGIAHIAIVNDTSCELAFSIDEPYRGHGLARMLMRIAIGTCHELGMNKLCMSCLRQNKKMQALARSFGLSMTIDFDEAYAELGITK